MSDEVTFSALGDIQAGNGDKRGVLNGPNKFRASFVLALVGVVLVFAGTSNVLIEALAIVCGIAALVARKVKSIDGVKLMGVQIPLSIIAMPLRRAYALPGAIFLVSA